MPISRCDCAGFRLTLGLVLLVVTYLSLTPQPPSLPDVPMSDKLAHFAIYALLAFLVDASWPEQGFTRAKWLSLFAYGVVIELLQSQIPNRLFSIADLAANMAGVASYAFLVLGRLRAWGVR